MHRLMDNPRLYIVFSLPYFSASSCHHRIWYFPVVGVKRGAGEAACSKRKEGGIKRGGGVKKESGADTSFRTMGSCISTPWCCNIPSCKVSLFLFNTTYQACKTWMEKKSWLANCCKTNFTKLFKEPWESMSTTLMKTEFRKCGVYPLTLSDRISAPTS